MSFTKIAHSYSTGNEIVDVYVNFDEKGINNIYVFGDDDFNHPSDACNVNDFSIDNSGNVSFICPISKKQVTFNFFSNMESLSQPASANGLNSNAGTQPTSV